MHINKKVAGIIRVIAFRLPDYKQLRIPEQVMKNNVILNKGLVLEQDQREVENPRHLDA